MSMFANSALEWLVTYALHGAILILPVWVITRFRALSLPMKDVLWKVALVGPILTATFQFLAGYEPPWGVALSAPVAAGAAGSLSSSAGATGGGISVAEVITVLWAAGAAFGVWRLGAALWRLRRELKGRQDVIDDAAIDGLVELRRRAGIRRRIRLTKSEQIATPLALGRSEICLTPQVIERLPAAQVRSIVAHELAHLERRDPRWLRIGALVESVFFVQPLNFLARRELRATSELLADERARRLMGTGEPLARALAEVAAWADGPQALPLVAAGASAGILKRRVERLLDPPQGGEEESYAPKIAACLGVVGVMALFAPGVVTAAPIEGPPPTALASVAPAPQAPNVPTPPEPHGLVIVDDGFTFGVTWHGDHDEGPCCGHHQRHVWAQPQWGALLGGIEALESLEELEALDDLEDLGELRRELRQLERELAREKREIKREVRRARRVWRGI
jgi:beta-lactamase regulating signal transducer with metallopeptidase domain